MKFRLSFLFLSFFLVPYSILCNPSSTNWDAWAQSATITYTITNAVTGVGEFLIDIPTNEVNFPGQDEGYRYFWSFGDGNYEVGEIKFLKNPIFPANAINQTDGSINSTTKGSRNIITNSFIFTTTHQYNAMVSSHFNPQYAYLELTPLYTDSKRPKKIAVNPINFPASSSAPLIVPPLPSKLSLFSIRDAVPGDDITFVVNFRDMCKSSGSKLFFYYDDSLMKFASVEKFDDDLIFQPSSGVIEFSKTYYSTNSSSYSNQNNVFIRFQVRQTSLIGSSIACSAMFRSEVQGGPPGDSTQICSDTTAYAENLVIALSHDPNNIASNTGMCLPPPSKLSYRINFQNDGGGPCSLVVVKNIVPEYFDPATMVTIKPAGLLPNYDPNTNSFSWVLQSSHLKNGKLRGLNEPGMHSIYSVDSTRDYIEFEIAFKPERLAKLMPCEVIINQAEIIFECNSSIMTNTFNTEFLCCNKECMGCKETKESLPANKTSGNPVIQTSAAYDNNIWYPAKGVQPSTSDLTPTMTPNVSTLYTLVSVDPYKCQRKIFELPVDVPKSYTAPHFIVIEDTIYRDCCLKLKVVQCDRSVTSPTYKYVWNYITYDGANVTTPPTTQNKLYLGDVRNVNSVEVSDGQNSVLFYPNVVRCARPSGFLQRLFPRWFCLWFN